MQTEPSSGHGAAVSPFRQPKAVWAVAFACVISFMGIGLVDPILPSLASKLNASPAQVELLFTSYLVVTAVAMLVTGWVSSRIGAKRTLIAGLVLIVVFAALAGSSGSISRDRRVPRGLGPGQRAVHRHVARGHRRLGAAAASPARSSCTRRRSASASPAARCSAACWATSAGAARSTACRVLMFIALVATIVLVPATPPAAAQDVHHRADHRAAAPRAGDDQRRPACSTTGASSPSSATRRS